MAEVEFEQQIEEYEDMMFGLMLYQETSPEVVRKSQEGHYESMKRRGGKALKEAKGILSDIKAGKALQDKGKFFEWPVITDEMQSIIDVMLKSYKSLWPDKPREEELSKEEIITLQNDAIKRITLGDVF